MKKKAIPNPVKRWLMLFGFVSGLLMGGMIFVLAKEKATIPFFCLTITTIFLFVVIDWRYEDVLQEWGITMKRKEKKTE